MATELHREGSDNRYIVIDEQERHLKLKCVWFCGKENLGDQIFCSKEGQEIWMAKYHTDRYVREEVEIKD